MIDPIHHASKRLSGDWFSTLLMVCLDMDGHLLVPAAFASLIGRADIKPPRVPDGLDTPEKFADPVMQSFLIHHNP